MIETVHDALASHPVETAVRRRLHDVRPHEVYEVEYDGRRAICKVKRHPEGDPALEARLLQFVAEETTVPVPEVLATGPGHFVAAWCPDLPDDPIVDQARLRAMGACMARLHDEAAGHFDAPGRPALDDDLTLTIATEDRWSDVLCSLLEDSRRFLQPRGHGALAADVSEFVEEFRWAFDAIAAPTLLHGNVLPDHVAVDRTRGGRTDDAVRASRLIDFEHAVVGPPVFDVLRTLGPLVGPPSVESDAADREAFLDGYRSVRSLPENLDAQLRRHEVVNTVFYVRSLYLQRGDRDSDQAVARRARGLEAHARDCLTELENVLERR